MGDNGRALAESGEMPPSARRFSYFCLHWEQNLCLGISPGEDEPVVGLPLQLKPYQRNFFKGTDQKKMRWDIIVPGKSENATDLSEGLLRLEAEYPTLCIEGSRPNGGSTLTLQECNRTSTHWFHDKSAGVIRMVESPQFCMTVARCFPREDKARSCFTAVNTPERNPRNFVEGSVIHAMPCFDAGDSYLSSLPAQLFTREIDCIAGCSPEVQNNGVCDEICNSPQCAFDKGECIDSPAPTKQPTHRYIESEPPSMVNDMNDGFAPNDSPNLWWLLLLLLLFCCMGTLLMRNRKKRSMTRHDNMSGLFMPIDSEKTSHIFVSPVEDEDADGARFRTTSAVALNQLRYHSRAVPSSSNNSTPQAGESITKVRPSNSSNNDRSANFQEVGLV